MTRIQTVERQEFHDTRSRLPDLVSAGCGQVKLVDPVDVTLDDAASVSALCLIRDATGHGLQVEWTLGAPPAEPTIWTHLFPPSAGASPAALEVAERWRRSYRFGACYFRIGPAFVTVKDVRPDLEAANLLLEGVHAETLLTLTENANDLLSDAGESSAIGDLTGVGLCRTGTAGVLVLPYRIRRWPIRLEYI